MDILEPMIVWVEGRCYRFCDYDLWMPKDKAAVPHVQETKPQECTNVKKETPPPDNKMKRNADGKYRHWLYIAKRYHPFIVGHGQSILNQIERETKTDIFVPHKHDEMDCLITGTSSSQVVNAINRLNSIIENARTRVEPTHFLSIPLIDETIKANFVKFRDAVLDECGNDAKCVRKEVFQKPEKLHLPLGMLLLVDNKEMKAAYAALVEWKKTIMMPIIEKNGPIKIKVEGLDCGHEVHSMVNEIYGRVSSENNVLQELADRTSQFFIEKGLMIPKRSSANLRVTLLSSLFAVNKKTRENWSNYEKANKFCASEIMTTHKDHFFGETQLEMLHLSERGKYDAKGYYATAAKIGV